MALPLEPGWKRWAMLSHGSSILKRLHSYTMFRRSLSAMRGPFQESAFRVDSTTLALQGGRATRLTIPGDQIATFDATVLGLLRGRWEMVGMVPNLGGG